MYLQDLSLKSINVEAYKADVFATYLDEADLTEDELYAAIGDNYRQAAEVSSNNLLESAIKVNAARESNFSILFTGRSIWEKVRKHLCKVLTAATVIEDIIDAILDVLIGIIPGGIVFKGVVRKVLKYFLNRGYEALCPVV